MTPEKLREIPHCIELSCEELNKGSYADCFNSGAKIVASEHIAGVMVLLAKADDLEKFKDCVFDYKAARKYQGSNGFVYNHENLVPLDLKGELLQAV